MKWHKASEKPKVGVEGVSDDLLLYHDSEHYSTGYYGNQGFTCPHLGRVIYWAYITPPKERKAR